MAHVHGAKASVTTHSAHAGHAMQASHAHTAMSAIKHAGAAGSVAVAAQTHTGKGLMSILSRNPLLVFSLGVAAGYLAYKYRKEIIASATHATELGKDFVMHQKENLEDLVSECQECPEDSEKA